MQPQCIFSKGLSGAALVARLADFEPAFRPWHSRISRDRVSKIAVKPSDNTASALLRWLLRSHSGNPPHQVAYCPLEPYEPLGPLWRTSDPICRPAFPMAWLGGVGGRFGVEWRLTRAFCPAQICYPAQIWPFWISPLTPPSRLAQLSSAQFRNLARPRQPAPTRLQPRAQQLLPVLQASLQVPKKRPGDLSPYSSRVAKQNV